MKCFINEKQQKIIEDFGNSNEENRDALINYGADLYSDGWSNAISVGAIGLGILALSVKLVNLYRCHIMKKS